MKVEHIDITPDISIMSKLGESGYSTEESIAELIDNSIDASKKNCKLFVEIKISDKEIMIKDNGSGMNKHELIDSLRLGVSKKDNMLGKFGLGMKTACLSLGSDFSVTTSLDGFMHFSVNYNEAEWNKNGRWDSLHLITFENKLTTGTEIVICGLKNHLADKQIEKLRDNLGRRFGKFLESDEMQLLVNKKLCRQQIPALTSDEKQNFDLYLNGDIKITGWFGFKLSGTIKDKFGFHTYRGRRLITTYDKIGISPNQKSKQIVGEINMDGIPIMHNKRNWIRESKEFRELEQKLMKFLQKKEKRLIKILEGTTACPGRVEGVANVISSFVSNENKKNQFEDLSENDILITEITRPEMLYYLQKVKGIIADVGGSLSHSAIVAREFNIPAIVGTRSATSVLKTGQKIILDATEGKVYVEA